MRIGIGDLVQRDAPLASSEGYRKQHLPEHALAGVFRGTFPLSIRHGDLEFSCGIESHGT
jgi:hypothetical protein